MNHLTEESVPGSKILRVMLRSARRKQEENHKTARTGIRALLPIPGGEDLATLPFAVKTLAVRGIDKRVSQPENPRSEMGKKRTRLHPLAQKLNNPIC
jgi:hypothetical protein